MNALINSKMLYIDLLASMLALSAYLKFQCVEHKSPSVWLTQQSLLTGIDMLESTGKTT